MGRVGEGLPGDLVLFDPKAVADRTSPGRADAPPEGIRAVPVDRAVVAWQGRLVPGVRRGRVPRR